MIEQIDIAEYLKSLILRALSNHTDNVTIYANPDREQIIIKVNFVRWTTVDTMWYEPGYWGSDQHGWRIRGPHGWGYEPVDLNDEESILKAIKEAVVIYE